MTRDMGALVAESRTAQGLPPKVTDPGALRRVAALFTDKPLAPPPPRIAAECVLCGGEHYGKGKVCDGCVRNERARQRAIPASLRREVLPLDARCVYCGHQADSIDHIVPVSRGGRTERENLVPSCWPCNWSKFTSTPEEWAARP